jgi:hypothetical protein
MLAAMTILGMITRILILINQHIIIVMVMPGCKVIISCASVAVRRHSKWEVSI